ncbi:hypothetical protein [Dactylosporangium salmoneum]|uniref:Uncharacterized protein n=1 Tax=Dactylosporangium salmoneum TaxID=53361 RepID=A0ABN3G133_9ACTN
MRSARVVVAVALLASAALHPAAVTTTAAPRTRSAAHVNAQGFQVSSAALAFLADRLQPAPVDQQPGNTDYVEFRFGDDLYEVNGGRPIQYARLQAWARAGGIHWTRVLRETGDTARCDVMWQDFTDFDDDRPAWFDVPPDDPAALDRFLLTNPYPPVRGDTADLYLLYRISWLAQEHVGTLRQRQTILRTLARHPGLAVQLGTRDDAGRPTITVSAAGIEHDPAFREMSVQPVRRVLVFDAGTGLLLTETLYQQPTVLLAGPHTAPHPHGSSVLDRVVFVDRQHVPDPTTPTLGCPLSPQPSSA